MKQCQIHDDALRFSRAVYALLVLVAILAHSSWLILAVAILTILGAFSFKLNVFYQFHVIVIKKLMKHQTEPVQKESAELKFVAAMTGIAADRCAQLGFGPAPRSTICPGRVGRVVIG